MVARPAARPEAAAPAVRLACPVVRDLPALDLRAGDVVIVDTGAATPVCAVRAIGAGAYGWIAGALADGTLSPPTADAEALRRALAQLGTAPGAAAARPPLQLVRPTG